MESLARKRLLVIALAALLNSTFAAGVEGIVLPLWVTRELKLSAAEWAHLRSLRWTGVLVGVVILSALSDRFGQRLIGALSMFGAALALLVMQMSPGTGLWMAMPVFGAMVSTSYVNLNVLTQQVSRKRQGMVNAVYRSMGAAACILAPILATSLALFFHGYRPVMLIFFGILVAAGCILLFYQNEPVPKRGGGMRGELESLVKSYRTALKQKQLMRIIHLSQIWSNTLAGVGAFAAIRFTQELGKSDRFFGMLSSVSGILTLIVIASAAGVLDRISLRKCCFIVSVLASACSILMGLSDSVVLSAAGFILLGPLAFSHIAPVSMWISRAAGDSSQTSAFSVHKLLTAVYVAATMAVVGFLEQKIGMRLVFLYGGIAGVVVGFLFLRLPDPEARE